MQNQKFKYILWFLFGALCFFISQPLIRIPILSYIQNTTRFTLFAYIHPILTGSVIGFTAGIAEESFRFLFKRFIIKPPESKLNQPVIFGLGHGLMEASLVLIPLLLAGYSLYDLSWGIIERFISITLHVVLTIIVWNGFQKNKRLLYLLIAIIIHGVIDASIVFFLYFKLTVPMIELIYAVIVLLLVIYGIYSRKFYKKEIDNEEN